MTERHVWIEITRLETLPLREWMCNVHPEEVVLRQQWEEPPTTTDEVARLRGLLRRLERARDAYPGADGGSCPVCRGGNAHHPDCWLAAAIAEQAPAPPNEREAGA
jgi:hypothetical protein